MQATSVTAIAAHTSASRRTSRLGAVSPRVVFADGGDDIPTHDGYERRTLSLVQHGLGDLSIALIAVAVDIGEALTVRVYNLEAAV